MTCISISVLIVPGVHSSLVSRLFGGLNMCDSFSRMRHHAKTARGSTAAEIREAAKLAEVGKLPNVCGGGRAGASTLNPTAAPAEGARVPLYPQRGPEEPRAPPKQQGVQ